MTCSQRMPSLLAVIDRVTSGGLWLLQVRNISRFQPHGSSAGESIAPENILSGEELLFQNAIPSSVRVET